MQTINDNEKNASQKNKNPISLILFLLISLSFFSNIAYASAESTCLQFDGQAKCELPLMPEANSSWNYVVTAGEWGDIWGTGSTPEAAAAAATAYSKAVPPFLAGPMPPPDCTNCDAMGRGSTSLYVGMTGSNFYNSAGPAYSTANFEGFLPQSESIPVSRGGGWQVSVAMSGSRTITPFRCPANTTKVMSSNPSRVGYPFMCQLPPEPKRQCPAPNNPIPSSCGNPVDYVSGNKIQKETDWSAYKGLLSISRIYNSMLENPNIVGATGSNAGNWDFNFNKHITLQFRKLDGGNLTKTNNSSAQVLFQSPTQTYNWQTKPTAFYPIVKIKRPGGNTQTAYFDHVTTDTNGALAKVTFKLDQSSSGIIVDAMPDGSWLYTDTIARTTETYNQSGQLTQWRARNGQFISYNYASGTAINPSTLTDNFGQTLQLVNDGNGRITQIYLPNYQRITYIYTDSGQIANVNRPGFGIKNYLYATDAPNLLTGIVDEKGQRFATYTYDSNGRAVSTEHAGGAEKYFINYGASGQRIVTDAGGRVTTYTLQTIQGYDTPTSVSDNTNTVTNLTFDNRGNVTSITKNGQVSQFTYDPLLNIETSRTEAVGKPQQRTITTEWTSLQVPLKVTEQDASNTPLRETTYSYDNNGNVITKKMTDLQASSTVSRTWSYTYNNVGQLLTETTPAGETSTYSYNTTNGNLLTITNALGQVTTYSNHDNDGRPWKIVYPNGHRIELVYDSMGRITQKTETTFNPIIADVNSTDANGNKWMSWPQWLVDLINNWCQLMGWNSPFTNNKTSTTIAYPSVSYNASQVATTKYYYDAVGQLVNIELPEGGLISYSYDNAHRLIGVNDAYGGNKITYSLNTAGDITETQIQGNAGGVIEKTRQVYDSLGRIQQTLGNNGQSQNNSYDSSGNLTSSVDNLGRTSQNSYDGLNRKVTETDPFNQTTTYEYNALDQLKKVIDPRNVMTGYNYNGFGEVVQQNSPDTGNTSYQYSNGRLNQTTDANNIVHQYQYDGLGRIISRTDGTDISTYTYDQGDYSVGYLSAAKNKNSEIRYTRDSAGRVLEKIIAIKDKPPLRVRYHYNKEGKLDTLVLPSGNMIGYRYAFGKISSLTWDYPNYNKTILNQIRYGTHGIEKWIWATGGYGERPAQYSYDSDGRPIKVESQVINSTSPLGNGLIRQYNYDAGNRISNITDSATNLNQSYSHDLMDRLTQQILGGQTLDYSYDANSNRTQLKKTQSGIATITNYSIGSSNNRISQSTTGSTNKIYQYLSTGQVVSDGERTFQYDSEGRSYRIQKGGAGILNLYDPAGQRIQKNSGNLITYFVYDEEGQLLGEYDGSGNMLREYVWLEGRLVGMFSYQYPEILLKVHTDHLGTVRAVSNDWLSSPMVWRWDGDQFGDMLPTGNLFMPLRHLGQYYDAEVGISYNYFRDYDPSTGRYVESDPIGLNGGNNTYGYVSGNPLKFTDPRGLIKWSGSFGGGAIVDGVGGGVSRFSLTSECACGKKITIKGYASFLSVGLGAKYTGTTSGSSFHDSLPCPDASVANGAAAMVSAGAAFGGGGGWSKITLGHLYSDWSNMPSGPAYGFDLSAGAYLGASVVTSSKEEPCCGKEN